MDYVNDDDFEDDQSDPPSEGIDSVDEEYINFTHQLPQETGLLKHPIFLLQNDSLLSCLTKPMESLVRVIPIRDVIPQNVNKFKEQIYREIFKTKQIPELKKEFETLNLVNKTACGKLIPLNGLYFRCLDCDTHDNASFISLLCVECFDNSNHDGHRILIVKKEKNSSATCDCGDSEAFKPEGFCTKHQHKEVDIQELLQKFPKDILQMLQLVLKKAFHGVISLYEIWQKAPNRTIGKAVLDFAEQSIGELFSFCVLCYSEISEAFLPVLGMVLRSGFQTPYNSLWHNCNDIKAETKPSDIDVDQPHSCTCTISGNLLRIGNGISKEKQSRLHKIFIECAKQNDFREFLSVEFIKYIHYLYSQNYTSDEPEDEANSRLLNMKTQLYGREGLLVKVLESGYFNNYISVLKRVICDAPQMNHEVYHIVSDARSSIIYFLNSHYKTSDTLLKETDLLDEVLETLLNFQMKFIYEGRIHIGLYEHNIQFNSLNCGLMTEKVLSQVVESGIRTICGYPNQVKTQLLQKLTKKLFSGVDLVKDVLSAELQAGVVSFHPALERLFSFLIKFYLGDSISIVGLENFFKEILPDVQPGQACEYAAQGILRSLGMVRYLHMVHNFKTGMLWYVYYFFNNTFFETDIAAVQIMAMRIDPKDLFEVLTRNFFSYSIELQDFFEDPFSLEEGDYFKQKISVLEDFLHFLVYIMNDEICFLNLELKDATSMKEEFHPNPRDKKIFEKVVINILLGQFWTDIAQTKNLLKEVLKEHHEVDEIIPKVTIIDEKNHKIRLKDEYIKEFDPYMFYRSPAIQHNILNNVLAKAKKDQPVDTVSGKYYSDLPRHLKTIQRNLYQSKLPNFLCLFVTRILPRTASLLRPVLKLVLLNLQVVDEAIERSVEGIEALIGKVKESYLTNKFAHDLGVLLKDETLRDCEACVHKIQELLKKLSVNLDEKAKIPKDRNNKAMVPEGGESQEEIKKRLAKERMQKVKEAFAKKQEMFKSANTDLLSKSFESEESKGEEDRISEESRTCQHCLDKIVEANEEYGIPIYISFTNNFYDTSEKSANFEKWDYNDLGERNWWPVVSSCNHYYHKSCFRTQYKNTRKTADHAKTFFSNNMETYCSLCKILCNSFLCLNNELPDKKDEDKDKDKEVEVEEVYSKLTKDIDKLLKMTVIKLKNNIDIGSVMEIEDSVTNSEIFLRAYEYYFEAFHLHKSHETLVKELNIYIKFFREYGNCLKAQSSDFFGSISFLKMLSEKYNKQEKAKAKAIKSLKEFECEKLLGKLFFRVFVNEVATFGDSFLKENQLRIIEEYLSFKITQLVTFENGIKPSNLHEILLYYKNTPSFQIRLLSELLFPVQKLVLAYYFNTCVFFPTEINELGKLLMDPLPTVDYFDSLLQQIGLLPLNQLLESSFQKLAEKSEGELLPFNLLLLGSTAIEEELKRPRIIKYAPQIMQLSPNFGEFNSKYFRIKCSLCAQYSKHLLSSVCLVCGQVMCQAYCDPDNKVYGNLNRHASEYHMGLGLFLDVQHLSKSILSVPVNAIFSGKNVYIDNLGQGIQVFLHERRTKLATLDFKKFLLNQEFLDYVEDVINHHSMGKEVFKISRTANYYYHNGNL